MIVVDFAEVNQLTIYVNCEMVIYHIYMYPRPHISIGISRYGLTIYSAQAVLLSSMRFETFRMFVMQEGSICIVK